MRNSERGAVVITGTSTGIGRATAYHLHGLGFRVYAGVRREADVESLTSPEWPRLTPIRIDVTDAASIEAAAATIMRLTGNAGLQGLVNNAGIGVAGALEFVPLDSLRRQLEVNVVGQVAIVQALLGAIRRGGGRIVNVGSIGGRLPMPLLGSYCASKAALRALSESLRLELQPWRIPVSLIEGGIIATPIFDKVTSQGELMLETVPEEPRNAYEPCIAAMRVASEHEFSKASPAEVVARAVGHALTARRPKMRYVVGHRARLEAFAARFLPDRLRDAVISRTLKLPTGG